MRKHYISTALTVLMVLIAATSLMANGVERAGAGPTKTPRPVYTLCQLVTLTVSQAWTLSGKDYTQFSRMVGSLADLSMQRRGVTIPDTVAAGTEVGRMIRERAQADPNQLLYVVVDSSIRDYIAKTTPR